MAEAITIIPPLKNLIARTRQAPSFEQDKPSYQKKERLRRAKEAQQTITILLKKAGLKSYDWQEKRILVIGPGFYCPEREALARLGADPQLVVEIDRRTETPFGGINHQKQTSFQDHLKVSPDPYDAIVNTFGAKLTPEDLQLTHARLAPNGIFIHQGKNYLFPHLEAGRLFGQENLFHHKRKSALIAIKTPD